MEEEKETPLLPATTRPYTAPPQSIAVEARSTDGKVESHDEEALPFCSKYLVFFFLGLFVCPLFLVFGMLGLEAKERHKIWAGKVSSVVCIIVSVLWTVIVVGLVLTCVGLSSELDEERHNYDYHYQYHYYDDDY